MDNRSTAKGLGIVCAIVCLLFAMISIGYGWGGGDGLSVSVGFNLDSVLQLYQSRLDAYGTIDPIWLFEVVGDHLSSILAALLLFVAVARGGRGGTFGRLLPVSVPVLWGATEELCTLAGGNSPSFSSVLSIHAVALVAFILVGVLGRPGSRAPIMAALALSIAGLVMLVNKTPPFGIDFGGAKGYFTMHVGVLMHYVALWFGTACVLMIEPESVPGVADPTLRSTSRVASAEAVASRLPADHPYRSLGGFLAFMVYGSYVCGALLAVIELYSVFVTLSALGQYASVDTYAAMGSTMTALFALWILEFALVGYIFWWASALKNRNPNFLRVYHYVAIVLIVAYFIEQLTTQPFVTALLTAALEVIPIVLGTCYFVRSVRVHAYFGSDEYLRRSPFTRGLQIQESVNAGNAVMGERADAAGSVTGTARADGAAPGGVHASPRPSARDALQDRKEKLTGELAELDRRRKDTAAQLGASLYDVTKGIASLRVGREDLYGAVESIDQQREELYEEIRVLEATARARTVAPEPKCPRCGCIIQDGDRFCAGCGMPVGDARG